MTFPLNFFRISIHHLGFGSTFGIWHKRKTANFILHANGEVRIFMTTRWLRNMCPIPTSFCIISWNVRGNCLDHKIFARQIKIHVTCAKVIATRKKRPAFRSRLRCDARRRGVCNIAVGTYTTHATRKTASQKYFYGIAASNCLAINLCKVFHYTCNFYLVRLMDGAGVSVECTINIRELTRYVCARAQSSSSDRPSTPCPNISTEKFGRISRFLFSYILSRLGA